jgi:hypothetical protein
MVCLVVGLAFNHLSFTASFTARGAHGLPKVSPGPAMPDRRPFYALSADHPINGLMTVSGVARLQGGLWRVAIFYPLGHRAPMLLNPSRGKVPIEQR